jgi:PAS domain S-box-containing protein
MKRKRMDQTAVGSPDRKYQSLFEYNLDAVFLTLPDGAITDANPAACALFGMSKDELRRVGRAGILVEDDQSESALAERTLKGSAAARLTYIRGDRTIFTGETTSAIFSVESGRVYSFVMVRDITRRMLAEFERGTIVEFLQFANTCRDLRTLIESSVTFLKEKTGCEAVGVRLKEGPDYPYFEARGFPAEFVAAESALCARNEQGDVRFDLAGDPVLECMCGNVIRGRFDPSKPFFTPQGSFWTNSTTELLATTSESGRQARTRNRCNGEGYESVALIPLALGTERFGLLQLNDRRKGFFTPESIVLWERIAGYLSVTAAQLRFRERLQASEEKYRRIVETAHEGIWAMDGKYRTTFVNGHMAAMLGYTAEQMLGRPVDSFMFESDLADHAAKMAVRCKGDSTVYERRFRRKDGTELWAIVSATALSDAGGRFAGSFAMFTNITRRKQSEEENRDSEETNRRLVEALTDAILVHSHGVITYVNPAALKLFKANRQEDLVGKRYLDMVHPDDRTGSVVRLRRNTEEGLVASRREHRILALDGQPVEVESIGVPFQHRGETQTFGVFRDITERRKSEKEKEKLEGQLRQAQKMEAIGTLAGGIAHDFNNLLGVVMGNAEMLNMREDVDSEITDNVDPILSAAKRAKQLVGQILAFSRQGEQQKLLINLKAIVKETLQFLRASLPATIQLRHYISADAGTIMADPTQMQQILMNLCTNAAHAMEEKGGTLTIELSNAMVAEEETGPDPGIRPGAYVRLVVSDTGHGMTPLVQERVFDPYFTTKGPGKGTGLGLSVVHGIVASHGGMIRLESELGKRTVFRVYFPRVREPAKPDAASAQSLPRGTERILLVDDEPALAGICKRMLSFLGYQVEVRTSAVDAFELFGTDPYRFDAVLTDMTMPNLTGLSLSKKILALRPDLPIIMCTGFSDQIDEAAIRSAGVRALILKPLVLTELATHVRRVLDQTA